MLFLYIPTLPVTLPTQIVPYLGYKLSEKIEDSDLSGSTLVGRIGKGISEGVMRVHNLMLYHYDSTMRKRYGNYGPEKSKLENVTEKLTLAAVAVAYGCAVWHGLESPKHYEFLGLVPVASNLINGFITAMEEESPEDLFFM